MKRRTLLRTLASVGAVGSIATAGCLGGTDSFVGSGGGIGSTDPAHSDESDEATPTPAPDDMTDETKLLDVELEEADCAALRITFGEDTVEVVGCVRGNNGCHRPEIADATLTDGTFRLTVASVDQSGPFEMCPQVIVNNGYLVIARFDGPPPARVEVIHHDMDGTRTVKSDAR